MKNHLIYLIVIITLLAAAPVFSQGDRDQGNVKPIEKEASELKIREALPDWTSLYSPDSVETAVFAGGCFWGVEAVFEQLDGVLDVDSGYSGGEADTAFYKMVGTGTTGHAEAVEIVFDPMQISYEDLLEVFFRVAHDPTQFNYQGPDHGTEYRSAVFYNSQQQKMAVEKVIKTIEDEGLYKEEIVTEISPLDAFYPAEDYHQDFLRLNPSYPYIVYWDLPKIADLHEKYPELIAPIK